MFDSKPDKSELDDDILVSEHLSVLTKQGMAVSVRERRQSANWFSEGLFPPCLTCEIFELNVENSRDVLKYSVF